MTNIFRNYKQVLNEYGQLEELETVYKALKEREKAVNEIIKSIGNPFRNLKVHDISGYLYELKEKGLLSYEEEINMFQWICEREYSMFEEFEKENCPSIKREYIGRTSSFCYEMIDSLEILDFEEHNFEYQKIDIDESIDYYIEYDTVALFNLLKGTNDDELIEQYKEHTDLFACRDIEEIEEIANAQTEDLQVVFERIEYDFEAIENALKEIQFILGYIDNYKTEENEIAIAKSYIESDLINDYNLVIDNALDETKDAILNKIHESRNNEKLNAIHFKIDDKSQSFVIEIEMIDSNDSLITEKVLSFDFNIDDMKSDEIITLFHDLLVDRLKELKNEFDY